MDNRVLAKHYTAIMGLLSLIAFIILTVVTLSGIYGANPFLSNTRLVLITIDTILLINTLLNMGLSIIFYDDEDHLNK
jgi:hypothetical protein